MALGHQSLVHPAPFRALFTRPATLSMSAIAGASIGASRYRLA